MRKRENTTGVDFKTGRVVNKSADTERAIDLLRLCGETPPKSHKQRSLLAHEVINRIVLSTMADNPEHIVDGALGVESHFADLIDQVNVILHDDSYKDGAVPAPAFQSLVKELMRSDQSNETSNSQVLETQQSVVDPAELLAGVRHELRNTVLDLLDKGGVKTVHAQTLIAVLKLDASIGSDYLNAHHHTLESHFSRWFASAIMSLRVRGDVDLARSKSENNLSPSSVASRLVLPDEDANKGLAAVSRIKAFFSNGAEDPFEYMMDRRYESARNSKKNTYGDFERADTLRDVNAFLRWYGQLQ